MLSGQLQKLRSARVSVDYTDDEGVDNVSELAKAVSQADDEEVVKKLPTKRKSRKKWKIVNKGEVSGKVKSCKDLCFFWETPENELLVLRSTNIHFDLFQTCLDWYPSWDWNVCRGLQMSPSFQGWVFVWDLSFLPANTITKSLSRIASSILLPFWHLCGLRRWKTTFSCTQKSCQPSPTLALLESRYLSIFAAIFNCLGIFGTHL